MQIFISGQQNKLFNWINKFPIFNYVLFFILALYITGLNDFNHWKIFGNADQDLTNAHFQSLYQSIFVDHQFPQFNPYSSGGTDFLANPQSPVGSVLILFIGIFGVFYGFKIVIVLAYFLGMLGAFIFLKKTIKSNGLSILGAILFGGLSYFNWHIIFAGHSNFLWLFALPWIANAHYEYFIAQNKKWKYILIMVLIYFQFLVGGAPFIFMYTAMFHVLMFVLTEEKFDRRNTLHFLSLFVFSIGISLWKLIPSIQYFRMHPRHLEDMEGIQPGQWLQAFRDYFVPTNTTDGWHEMAGGSHWILLGLALFSMYMSKRKWWIIAIFLLLVWFTLGNYPVGYSPWYFLNKYVPPFTSLRTPMRAVIFVHILVLFYSLKVIPKLPFYLVARIVLLVICFGVVGKSKEVSRDFYKNNFNSVVQLNIPKQNFAQINKSKNDKEFEIVKSGRGVLNAYEPMELPPLNYKDSQWIRGGEIVKHSSNKIEINKLSDTLKLAIRNFDNNWKIAQKGFQIDQSKTYLQITGNKGILKLVYSNKYLFSSFLISLIFMLTLPLWLYYLVKKRVYVATVIIDN